MHRYRHLGIGYALVYVLQACQACTVWEMGISGLASAANNLFLALPVFYGTNGTFFIDNRQFSYSCSETDGWQNGWHDFFVTDDVLNWKPEHERDFGTVCRKVDVGIIHPLLQGVQLSYNDLQTVSALKVRLHFKPWPLESPFGPLPQHTLETLHVLECHDCYILRPIMVLSTVVVNKQMWRLQPWVQSKVNAALKRANEQPRPTIGFHMRGGAPHVNHFRLHLRTGGRMFWGHVHLLNVHFENQGPSCGGPHA
jgi:hypothetical protein